MSINVDVIIVGGGISGMTAAYHLKQCSSNIKVLVLEAKPRLGGRTLTVDMKTAGGKTSKFDLGGQWVGPLQSDLLSLLEELDMSDLLYPQFSEGVKICWVDPKQIRKYKTELPFYNPLIHLEAFFFLRKVDKLAAELDENNPYLINPGLADYLDSITVEAFIREQIHSPALRELIRIGLRSAFGMEGTHMSALYLCLYGKASGRVENVFSATNDGTQRWRVKDGTQQICTRLCQMIGKDSVLIDSPVTAIEQTKDSVRVSCSSAGNFTARRVILAIPPHQILNIQMSPPLPAARRELYRAMPAGNICKFIATYENAFWRQANLSGETCCFGGDVDTTDECPVGIACVTFDATLVDGAPALVGLFGGHQSVYWRNQSAESRRKAILGSLAKMLGDEALEVIDFREKDWADEPWNGGCPVSVVQPGVGRFLTSGLRLPIGDHIFLAGTESAQRSCGFISGAVQAGRRAAVEALFSMGSHCEADNGVLQRDTSFFAAGKTARETPRWLTTSDGWMTSVGGGPGWPVRLMLVASTCFVIHRYLWPHFISK